MPRVELNLTADVERTPRVVQLDGMYDLDQSCAAHSLSMDVPLDDHSWTVGLIVGPSGCGKSQVMRRLFGEPRAVEWPRERAIVDGFDCSMSEAVAALSSVGLSSVPAWRKPYHVLSNGERFRADMARLLAGQDEVGAVVVVDEFTSMVDRQVAKVTSHAVSKAARRLGRKFVAVSCHDDILEWLQPDWVLQPHAESFAWREQRRRPTISMELVRVERSAWRWFHRHHYMSADLHRASRCFCGMIGDVPAVFVAVLPMPHPSRSDLSAVHRIVTMPDWQGAGVGMAALNTVAAITKSAGRALGIVTSHRGLQRALARSASWKMIRKPSIAAPSALRQGLQPRRTASFRWNGGPWQSAADAARMWS